MGDDNKQSVGFIRTMANLLSRTSLAQLVGKGFGGNRDYYSVFGWKRKITLDDFMAKYERQDIVSRIIDAPPGATWSNPPAMVASNELKTAWDAFVKEHQLWQVLYRADRQARLTPYSVLMFGFDDGRDAKMSVGNNVKLLFMRALSARSVDEITLISDVKDPRYGQPEQYKVTLHDPKDKIIQHGTTIVANITPMAVHHTRILHIVDNPIEDPIVGTPVMEKIYNLLDDLLKVSGGSSETFWLAANRGLQADIDKEIDIDPADAKKLADEIDEYQHQLRRVIKTRGVELNSLGGDVIEPKSPFEVIMALISGTTGIPRRILLGSEAGQLASEQDRANWAERIDERRFLFAEPAILNPLVMMLQEIGILPEGEFEWDWPDAFIMSPAERTKAKADIGRAIQSVSSQTKQGGMQIVTEKEAREMFDLEGNIPDNERVEVVPETGQLEEEEEEEVETQPNDAPLEGDNQNEDT